MPYQTKSGVWVIDASPFWICLLHKDPRAYDPPRDGKWVLHDHPSRLREIAYDTLEHSIASGRIEFLKFRPTYNDEGEPFANNPPPLCVYATRKSKEEIFRSAKRLRVERRLLVRRFKKSGHDSSP